MLKPLVVGYGKTQAFDNIVLLHGRVIVVGFVAVSRRMWLDRRVVGHVASSNNPKVNSYVVSSATNTMVTVCPQR